MEIRSFDLRTAEEGLIDSWYRLNRTWSLENIPDEPVFSREDLVEQVLASLHTRDLSVLWAGDDSGGMGAMASLSIRREEGSSFPCFMRIFVHPGLRRRGIATSLLKELLVLAGERGMKKARFITCSRCPAGESFMVKLGAEVVETSLSNRLSLNEVNGELLEHWLKLPERNFPGVVMGEWIGASPAESTAELVEFYQAVHDADRGKPGFMEFRYTEEMLKRNEEAIAKGTVQTHTIFFRDRHSGKLLGITEVVWNLQRPEYLSQGYTAVAPEARGRGLGRRLKAEMIMRIREILPEARFIRSGNADHRGPILQINEALGFRCTHTSTVWTSDIPLRSLLPENHEPC